jgi:hypothetical protein
VYRPGSLYSPAVIAEFNVWLLIVGLVVGAGLAWLVMLDGRRRETEIDAVELPREAAWLSAVLAEDGYDVSPEAAEQALLLHRAYLGAPPPDPAPDELPQPASDDQPELASDDQPDPAPEVRPDPPQDERPPVELIDDRPSAPRATEG